MVLYRRNRVPGGTYFFTVTLNDRRSCALVDHIDALRDAFRFSRRERPFDVDAIVILPDHLHAIMTLPAGDADFSSRWRRIKGLFTRHIAKTEGLSPNASGEYPLWQRRFWEHTIRDDEDFVRHVDYIHINPVKHGHATRARDWPYSSFHRYVREDILPADWAGGNVDDNTDFGERRI
jgi:putative transposase